MELFTVATTRTWELTLDAELLPASHDITAGRAQAVTDRLAHSPGVVAAAVRPHCEGRFLLAQIAVEAVSLADALDRSVAYLRNCAVDAGVGPLILVAARYSVETQVGVHAGPGTIGPRPAPPTSGQ